MPKNNMFLYVLEFDSGKRYVGITKCSIKKRLHEHRHAARHGEKDSPVYRAWRKYGEPVVIYLEKHIDHESLLEAERFWIAQWGRANLYNATSGGESTLDITEETREKLSEHLKAQWLDPNFRHNQLERLRKWSNKLETRKLLSEKAKARWANPEWKEKTLKVLHSPEYRQKQSIAHSNQSEETRRKKGEATRIRWTNPKYRERAVARMREVAAHK